MVKCAIKRISTDIFLLFTSTGRNSGKATKKKKKKKTKNPTVECFLPQKSESTIYAHEQALNLSRFFESFFEFVQRWSSTSSNVTEW